jgi:hypothetical protein
LKEFLCAVIGERSRLKREQQVLRSINKSEQFQVRQELLQYSDRRATIDDDVFVAFMTCFQCDSSLAVATSATSQ